MTDMEMDLYITQAEGRILKQTVKEQQNEIDNLKNNVRALQIVIEGQRKCIDRLASSGGVCNG